MNSRIKFLDLSFFTYSFFKFDIKLHSNPVVKLLHKIRPKGQTKKIHFFNFFINNSGISVGFLATGISTCAKADILDSADP